MTDRVDRRTALRKRHHDAIINAARELIDERGGPEFSVDELAERADVARRTIFNHFPSLDDVLVELCEEEMIVVVTTFLSDLSDRSSDAEKTDAVFDALERATRQAAVPSVIRTVTRTLGVPGSKGARRGMLSQAALDRATKDVAEHIHRRSLGTDLLDCELLVQFLTSGLVVIGRHWYRRTGGNLDAAGQALWDALVEQLLVNLRRGYPST